MASVTAETARLSDSVQAATVPAPMSVADETGKVGDAICEKPQLLWRNWMNLVAYVVNFAVTYGSLLGWFGPENGELSDKYHTLVTPSGLAFAIWGPIFIGEGVFAVAQMLPRFRRAAVLEAVTPWWLGACAFQISWTPAFAQEVIPLALVTMYGILACLLGLSISTDGFKMTRSEYWMLRAPFSLHLGWIVAASVLMTNVQADAAKASPEAQLALAVVSFVAVSVVATVMAFVVRSPDPIVCGVVAWALNGIRIELGNPLNLDNPDRFNPYTWDRVTIGGFQNAALTLECFAVAVTACAIVRQGLNARWAAQELKQAQQI